MKMYNFAKMQCLLCIFIFALVYADDVCVMKNPCSCVFPNGTGIDISPTKKTGFYQANMFFQKKEENNNYELSTYYFHPCSDALFTDTVANETSTCTDPLSICRHVYVMTAEANGTSFVKGNGSYDFLGNTQYVSFNPDGQSITYENGPSNTTVYLVCAQSDDALYVTDLSDSRDVKLTLFSKYACLRQIEEYGRSTGSTLLIILFSVMIFYLVLGVLTKKFLMGATGIEVIPNLAFWTELPGLVKDGWIFAISGFKLPARGSAPASSPDPRSYDSI